MGSVCEKTKLICMSEEEFANIEDRCLQTSVTLEREENVSLIMILKITGPALGLGLRPLILCLKLSIEKTKKH